MFGFLHALYNYYHGKLYKHSKLFFGIWVANNVIPIMAVLCFVIIFNDNHNSSILFLGAIAFDSASETSTHNHKIRTTLISEQKI